MLKFFPSSSISGLHYFSCQCHLFRKEVNNVHPECECTCWRYSKKKTNKQSNEKKYSKTNNERVHRDCNFWISSIALLSWISEIRKKRKKPQKLTVTNQMEHCRVLSSQTYGFSFASAKPTRWKYLKILITFSTAHLFFDMLQYCYYRGELPISWHSRPRGCLKLYF